MYRLLFVTVYSDISHHTYRIILVFGIFCMGLLLKIRFTYAFHKRYVLLTAL